MITEYPILLKCSFCNGDGERTSSIGDNETVSPCASCNSTGYNPHAVLVYPENIVPAYVILEATDVDEIDDLTVPKTRCFNGVIGAGFVDISEGSNAMALLNGAFGESSTTMTNIAELR